MILKIGRGVYSWLKSIDWLLFAVTSIGIAGTCYTLGNEILHSQSDKSGFLKFDLTKTAQFAGGTLTAYLGISTFRHAQKTLFQPLRTEVFKEQLAVLRKVNELFSECDTRKLIESFGIGSFEKANVLKVLNDFAEVVFADNRPVFKEQWLEITESAAFKARGNIAYRLISSARTAGWKSVTEKERVRRWRQDYLLPVLVLPVQYISARARLASMEEDLLLPASVRVEIEALNDKLDDRFSYFVAFLEEAASKLPDSFQSIEALRDEFPENSIDAFELLHRSARRRLEDMKLDMFSLQPLCKKVLRTVHLYLKQQNLLIE